jgi:hypothetical protein
MGEIFRWSKNKKLMAAQAPVLNADTVVQIGIFPSTCIPNSIRNVFPNVTVRLMLLTQLGHNPAPPIADLAHPF